MEENKNYTTKTLEDGRVIKIKKGQESFRQTINAAVRNATHKKRLEYYKHINSGLATELGCYFDLTHAKDMFSAKLIMRYARERGTNE